MVVTGKAGTTWCKTAQNVPNQVAAVVFISLVSVVSVLAVVGIVPIVGVVSWSKVFTKAVCSFQGNLSFKPYLLFFKRGGKFGKLAAESI